VQAAWHGLDENLVGGQASAIHSTFGHQPKYRIWRFGEIAGGRPALFDKD
jgi:hypothetical protein